MANESIRINRSSSTERYRYVCPNEHTVCSWSPCPTHLHCQACQRTGVHAEHCVIIDKREETIYCWCNVEVVRE